VLEWPQTAWQVLCCFSGSDLRWCRRLHQRRAAQPEEALDETRALSYRLREVAVDEEESEE
jgi:hypothetical protein